MGLLNKQKLFEKGQKILCCTNVALKESNVSKKHKEQKLNICRNNSLDFCDCAHTISVR